MKKHRPNRMIAPAATTLRTTTRFAMSRSRVSVVLASLAMLALVGCAEAAPPEAQYPAPLQEQSPPQAVQPMPLSDEQVAQSEDSAAAAQYANGNGDGQDVAIGVDNQEYADADPSALTEFKPVLEPYGTWGDDATYGSVWTPSPTVVGADFSPYVTAGRWTYNNEYVWVSDYDWGWAPFHYGRWVFIGGRGWSWIPGRRYSGAWVVWRTGDAGYGYVGWAAAPPLWYWRGGYAYGVYNVPPAPYVFCPTGRVFEPAPGRHIVTGAEVAVVGAHTRPYVPAQPTVNASGNGGTFRGVGVGNAMNAGVASRPAMVRAPNGPNPRDLGIADVAIAAPPAGDRGLAHARDFGTPRVVQLPSTVARPADPRFMGAQPRNSRLDPNYGNGAANGRLPELNQMRPAPVTTQPMPRPSMPTQQAPVFRPQPMPQSVQRPMPSPTPIARPAPSYTQARPQMAAPVMRPAAPQFHVAPQMARPAPQMSRPSASPHISVSRGHK